MLERLFHLSTAGTTVRTEIVAGATTFLAMAYIVFVQPTVLAAAGMDPGAVLTATCLASAIATLIMAFAANYPIAVAPAMGHNFFFAFTVVVAGGTPWPVALGAVALAGLMFILTAGIGLRERVITAIPASLKHAISVGIGLLIALIGLEWAGVVVDSPRDARHARSTGIPAGDAGDRHARGDGRADGARRSRRDADRDGRLDRRGARDLD